MAIYETMRLASREALLKLLTAALVSPAEGQMLFRAIINLAPYLLGVSEEELAEHASASLPTVRAWQRGDTIPLLSLQQHIYRMFLRKFATP